MEKDKRTMLALGGIVSAFVASLCCVGPLVFAIAGMGVFGAATLFGELRPYFLTAAIIFLAGGFYFTYRPKKIVCEDGTCKTITSNRSSKILLWLTAALVVLFGISPYFTAYLLPKTPETNLSARQPLEPSLQSISFQVRGMTCGGCVANVESALKNVAGVKTAQVDLDTETAKVIFDPAQTNRNAIAEAVKASGYTPVL